MIDYSIKTDSKEHLLSLLQQHTRTEEGNTYIVLDGVSLDMGIPVILTPAVMSADNETVVTPATFKSGYYTNVRCSTDEADVIVNNLLGAYMTDEDTGRVWA